MGGLLVSLLGAGRCVLASCHSRMDVLVVAREAFVVVVYYYYYSIVQYRSTVGRVQYC